MCGRDSVWEAPENMGCLRGISQRDGSCAINFFTCQPALNYGYYNRTRPWQQSPDDEGPKATLNAMMDVDALLAGTGLRRLPGGYGGQSGEKRPGQPGHHRPVAESSRVSGCGIPGSGHGLRVGRAGKVPARGVPYGLSAPLRPIPLQRPVPVRGALFLRPGRGRRVAPSWKSIWRAGSGQGRTA